MWNTNSNLKQQLLYSMSADPLKHQAVRVI
jgi:hypothetical protein